MSRNKALTALQKTYDDTYLSCSTAVYHETQGNETESMRHWKGALEQIYDYNANKALPSHVPRTDTEKALMDALKSLELQCKERIDLLEALRISRVEENGAAPTGSSSSRREAVPRDFGPGSPGLGNGTIPAVTYAELSRPSLPLRPSHAERTASAMAVVGGDLPEDDQVVTGTPLPELQLPESSGRVDKDKRTESPGKHTMRTTLRSKSGEKSAKPIRKTQHAGEGPSKAATLAWSSLASRDRAAKQLQVEASSVSRGPSPRKSTESPRRAGSSNLQWDSHSRRLVKPRSTETRLPHLSDDASRSPQLSVSAASSALNCSANLDAQNSGPSTAGRRTRSQDRSAAYKLEDQVQASSQERNGSLSDTPRHNDSKECMTRLDSPARRKPVPRRKPAALQGSSYSSERLTTRRPSGSSDGGNETSLQSNDRSDGQRRSTTRRPASNEERPSTASSEEVESPETTAWKKRKAAVMKNLPAGVDEAAAKQILNDIIVEGDEVRWNDIAGLDIAKAALREAVVYPFLRPDLFMGLREPTRGMLLFGPPGTGKTMLARAVATESRSTFFSISASSLTSKYLGESEKLVRALFGLARALSPSIIFVDEIDSLLSQRSGSGEHEATRRIKTEFLIQWSDLQRAAAGRETTDKDKERGDANRVLVLAATNLPWAIDEAARRRFVRRQYIPLPEPTTRETQLRTLLGQQKHNLTDTEILELVRLTDGFSGSDMTALAKDAAMGPLRSLGEALLHMTMEDIRPIMLVDFEASLVNIRPSVGKNGLKEYEDWAKEFGERGG